MLVRHPSQIQHPAHPHRLQPLRLTQRSVKFIRWLRQNLWSERPLPELWAILSKLYRTS